MTINELKIPSCWFHYKIARNKLCQRENEQKRLYLSGIYERLIYIFNLYPNESPSDILKHHADNSLLYTGENYDSVIICLEKQIHNFEDKLNMPHLSFDDKAVVITKIGNREGAIEKLYDNQKSYNMAKNKLANFYKSMEQSTFELYASQDVKNCRVFLEVAIDNIFVAGRSAISDDKYKTNIIDFNRRNLIMSMRADLGTLKNPKL